MYIARLHAWTIAFAAMLSAAAMYPAAAVADDFYAGKSIDLLIGAPAGGGYDI